MRANNVAVIPRGLIVTQFFKQSFESEDNFVFNQPFIVRCSFFENNTVPCIRFFFQREQLRRTRAKMVCRLQQSGHLDLYYQKCPHRSYESMEPGLHADLKSVNLQYITLGCLDNGTNESSTKSLKFQVFFYTFYRAVKTLLFL